TEGELSSRFAELVRAETCAEVAVALELGDAVLFGGSRSQQRALQTVNVLGDVCEAVIAAIYLDGGIEPARSFVTGNWRPRMLAATPRPPCRNGRRHRATVPLPTRSPSAAAPTTPRPSPSRSRSAI